MEQNASITAYRAELEKIARRDRRIIDRYASEALKQEMNSLVVWKGKLEDLIARTQEAPVLLHPNMAVRYRKEVSRLMNALDDDEHRHEDIELIRSLIDKIVLVPDPDSKGLLIDLHGDLAGILNIATEGESAKPGREIDIRQIRIVAGLENQPTTGEQDKVVGPAGLEPATTPL